MWNAIMSHVNVVKFFLFTWTQNTWHMTYEMCLFTCELKFHHVKNRIISHANWMWRHQHVKFTFSHINYVNSLFSHKHIKSCEMILFTCDLIFLSEWLFSNMNGNVHKGTFSHVNYKHSHVTGFLSHVDTKHGAQNHVKFPYSHV